VALNIRQISSKVEALKRRYNDRDIRMADVLEVRRGNLVNVFPEMFPEGATKAMVANFVDVAARDVSEVLAPLPSFNCATTNNNSDRAKKNADIRTLIVNNYVQLSRLQTQMYQGADWYGSYGFLPIVVEPDTESRMPRIRVENPIGSYPEFDRYGRVTSFTKRYVKTIAELITEFPEYERQILDNKSMDDVDLYGELEMIRYEDKDQIILYLPNRDNLMLTGTDNPMGEVMVRVAQRPGIDSQPRGQFDDVLWVQIARARFAQLAMDAAEKSINAPLAVPNDVQEFAFGPDAILRTAQPQNIRRVGLEVPPAAFTEAELLQREMRIGARYPEGRSGIMDASIITGQGVQALLGAFDTQVKTGQQILSDVFEDIMVLCLKMDEKLFPGSKKITATSGGARFELEYDSRKDIKGDYSVQVRYGLMSGLDPSRALIFSLQALGADLVSRDFVMRELPWSMNVGGEQQQIDVQRMRDNLNASMAALSQAIPQLAMQGQDPSKIVADIAEVIKERQRGTNIEDAVKKVFAPEPPPQVPPAEMMAPVEQPVPAAPVEAPPGGPSETAPEQALQMQQMQEQPMDIQSILGQLGG
jgi:hypothetical protein